MKYMIEIDEYDLFALAEICGRLDEISYPNLIYGKSLIRLEEKIEREMFKNVE